MAGYKLVKKNLEKCYYFRFNCIITEIYRVIYTFDNLRCDMVKNKIGITLDDTTLSNLNELASKLGLSKSAAIAYIINSNSQANKNLKMK